jgi:hypothetical protein
MVFGAAEILDLAHQGLPPDFLLVEDVLKTGTAVGTVQRIQLGCKTTATDQQQQEKQRYV